MTKLVIGIQKGGVGKTVTALNLSHALVREGYKVLLVDIDPQSDSSRVCLKTETMPTRSVADVFTGEMSTDIILRTHIDNNLYVLPASSELSKVEYKSLSVEPNAMALRAYLEQKDVDSFFDFAILDTPSTLGFLMVAALKTADHALIPVEFDAFTYSDLSIYLDVFEDTQRFLTMKGVQHKELAKPNLLGIVPVGVDMRLAESKYWKREYQLVYKDLFWGTNTINSNAPTSAALVLNQTIFMYDKSARNCNQYTDLAKRLVKEMMKVEQTNREDQTAQRTR